MIILCFVIRLGIHILFNLVKSVEPKDDFVKLTIDDFYRNFWDIIFTTTFWRPRYFFMTCQKLRKTAQ